MPAEDVDEAALAERLYAPELGEIDLLIRASGELRISNFLLWELAYAELVFTDTLWPDFDVDDLRAAVEAYAARQRRFGARGAAVSRSSRGSSSRRCCCRSCSASSGPAAGGSSVSPPSAALLALHELYAIARGLRPIVLGGYVGVLLTLLGAQLGGATWVLPGILATLPAALLVFFVSSARQHAVAGFAVTVLGVAWVGGGLAYLMLLRDIPERRAAPDLRHAAHGVRGRHGRVLRRARDRPPPDGARDLAREVVGGIRRRARSPRSRCRSSRSTTRTS